MGTIMVGVSESTSGHPAIGWAVRHARRRGDTVELVHGRGPVSRFVPAG